jgi:hypothetical protein
LTPRTYTREEAILLQFRQVSKKQQEIADAVGVNPTDKCLRLSGNLDTCPKNQKLAALFEEAINAAGNVIGNVTVNVSCV